ESRRTDNQLRGHSGRQGDPGLSKFFLLLEDDLMRIFGSDRMRSFLQKVGLKNNEAIHHLWINKALEKAQKKVEARNYDVRKSLLKFDDVINSQRKVFFKQRSHILESIVHSGCYEDYVEDIAKEFHTKYGMILDREDLAKFVNKQEALDYVNDKVQGFFTERERYFNSQQTTNLWNTVVKQVMIMTLDHLWREHFSILECLRQSINLRAMGQKDPLSEFKREAFLMFESVLKKWKELTVHRLAYFKLVDNQEIDIYFTNLASLIAMSTLISATVTNSSAITPVDNKEFGVDDKDNKESTLVIGVTPYATRPIPFVTFQINKPPTYIIGFSKSLILQLRGSVDGEIVVEAAISSTTEMMP
ncbi:SecA wing/scaffold domain protein, partial [Dictyocaulus viviparus]